MARAQTIVAGALTLIAAFVFMPACSVTSEDEAAGPSCTNGSRDDGEEGTDCGGTCPTKCTGSGCTTNAECTSNKCENGACGAPAGKPCGVGVSTSCELAQPCELDRDCKSGFCDSGKCGTASAESHADGKINGGETGVDCGGSVKATAPCPDGQKCVDSTDCVGTCTDGTCGPIGPTDGKKNQGETDIDCGGPTAPKCAAGKACEAKTDCVDDYCPDATKKCTVPTYTDGEQNGTETDVDCGGTGAGMKKCAQGKACLVDGDCNGGCNYAKKCVDVRSCKQQHGGDTCGVGDLLAGQAEQHSTGAGLVAGHEDCCRTLEVANYPDPNQPGKKVYLDKYEITAGRMRVFLETLGGGVDAAGNAKPANVQAYMAANRPARWNMKWETTLPQANFGPLGTYTVTNPTGANVLYFGNDLYQGITPHLGSWGVASGTYNVDFGIFYSLGGGHLFPELSAVDDYGAAHALNCYNGTGSYGYSTYWFDKTTVTTYSGGTTGKLFTKDQLDEKSLTCVPFGLLAAFCAWDGGQLMTAEVSDNITGNTNSSVYSAATQNGKLAPGMSSCGPGGNSYITYSDGASPCYPYFFPNDQGNTYDGSSRIAPPGRMPADAIVKTAGDEPWMDMIGNLHEAVFKAGETERFDYRGYGHEYGSILYHKTQQMTPRAKGGSFGGRCMRFK